MILNIADNLELIFTKTFLYNHFILILKQKYSYIEIIQHTTESQRILCRKSCITEVLNITVPSANSDV